MDSETPMDNVENEENIIIHKAMDAGFNVSEIYFVNDVENDPDIPESCRLLCIRNHKGDLMGSAESLLSHGNVETCMFLMDRMVAAFSKINNVVKEVGNIPCRKNGHCSVIRTVHDIVEAINLCNEHPFIEQSLISEGFRLYLQKRVMGNPVARVLKKDHPLKENLPLIFLNSLNSTCEMESECLDHMEYLVPILPEDGVVTVARSCDANNLHALKELFPDRTFVISPHICSPIESAIQYGEMTGMDLIPSISRFRYSTRYLSSSIVLLFDVEDQPTMDLAKDIVHGYRVLNPNGVMVAYVPTELLTHDDYTHARKYVFENTKIRAIVSEKMEYEYPGYAFMVLSPKDLYGGKVCMNLTFDEDFSLPLHELTYGSKGKRDYTVLVPRENLDRRWCLEDAGYCPERSVTLKEVMPFEKNGIRLKPEFETDSIFGVAYADENYFADISPITRIPLSKCSDHIVKGSSIILGSDGSGYTYRMGGGYIVPGPGTLVSRYREDEIPGSHGKCDPETFEAIQLWRFYVMNRYVVPMANSTMNHKGTVTPADLENIKVPAFSLNNLKYFRNRSFSRNEDSCIDHRYADCYSLDSENCRSFKEGADRFDEYLGEIYNEMMSLDANRIQSWGLLNERLRSIEDLKLTYIRAFMDYTGLEALGSNIDDSENKMAHLIEIKNRLESECNTRINSCH